MNMHLYMSRCFIAVIFGNTVSIVIIIIIIRVIIGVIDIIVVVVSIVISINIIVIVTTCTGSQQTLICPVAVVQNSNVHRA